VAVEEHLGMLFLGLSAAGIDHNLEHALRALHYGDFSVRGQSLKSAMNHDILLSVKCLTD
jgi:hypothetical protein